MICLLTLIACNNASVNKHTSPPVFNCASVYQFAVVLLTLFVMGISVRKLVERQLVWTHACFLVRGVVTLTSVVTRFTPHLIDQGASHTTEGNSITLRLPRVCLECTYVS